MSASRGARGALVVCAFGLKARYLGRRRPDHGVSPADLYEVLTRDGVMEDPGLSTGRSQDSHRELRKHCPLRQEMLGAGQMFDRIPNALVLIPACLSTYMFKSRLVP